MALIYTKPKTKIRDAAKYYRNVDFMGYSLPQRARELRGRAKRLSPEEYLRRKAREAAAKHDPGGK